MDELSQTLQQLGQAIRHEVDEHQLEEGLQNVHRIHHRRRRRNQGLAAVAGTAALILVVGLGWRHLGTPGEDPQVYATYEPIRLGLGTQATPLTQDTQVRVIQVQPERLALTLPRGSARFSVEPNPSRTVHLTVGHVQIDVLGTTFTVERQPGRVRVDVDKGRVRVRWPEGERILKDQEGGWFSNPAAQTAQPHEGPSVAAEEADTTQEPSQTEPSDDVDLVAGAQAPQPQTEPSRAAQAPGARRRWQTLAKSGDYKGAFEVMKRAPTVRDVPAELLLAADVARLSGHPRRAVPHLKRLVQRHPGDGRAGLAAFTLGRLYMNSLGQPAQAAQMFARVQRLPGRALAQDALGREMQAWTRAGRTTKAKAAAQRYLKRYPKGPWAAKARKVAGVSGD